MLQTLEHATVEEASKNLVGFILAPENWVGVDGAKEDFRGRPGAYVRHVDSLRVRASVDINERLGVYLHIAFRGPGLTPLKAAEHLESFLTPHFALIPNTEWQVEVDGRRWIHFRRKYTQELLQG